MDKVTPGMVAATCAEKGFMRIGHHKCSMCGYPTGYNIKPDGVVFDAGCDCTGRYVARPSSFDDIAHTFNMQTPEVRARMWQDFIDGKPLID